MLIDWSIYGLLIWGLVAWLNATAFKARPASRGTAWALTVAVFVASLVAMTALKFLRYQVISEDLGFEIRPRAPFDAAGALAFSWLFFFLLRKSPRLVPAPSSDVVTPRQATVSPSPTASPSTKSVGELERTITSVAANPSAPSGTPTEESWSTALAEFDSSSRRPGLWARAFSEGHGVESVAKALYLGYRASELQVAHAARAAEIETNEQEVRRREALSSQYVDSLTEQQRSIHANIGAAEGDPDGSLGNLIRLVRLLGGRAEWEQSGLLRAEWNVAFNGADNSFRNDESFRSWAWDAVLPAAKTLLPQPNSDGVIQTGSGLVRSGQVLNINRSPVHPDS